MIVKIKTIDVEGKTYGILENGNPVYVHDDGKEIAFDAKTTVATISRLNGEAKSHREGKEAAEERLKAFTGISDPTAALKALDIVSNLDMKKLIDAGQVEKVKEEAKKGYDAQLKSFEEGMKPILAERDALKQALINEKVGGAFARSQFIKEKVASPLELVQSYFGSQFKLEGDHVVAYDRDGKQVFSRAKPGNIADFDEALEIMIDSSPFRDNILKGSGANGGGAGGAGGANGSKRTVTRAQFNALDAANQAATAKAASAGTVALVD